MQPGGLGGVGGQAADQFRDVPALLVAAPMRQQPGLVAGVEDERDMRAAVAQAHDAVAVVQQRFRHGQVAIRVVAQRV